jgi:hypothetical protein
VTFACFVIPAIVRHDSVITPEIAHDLLLVCTKIGDGRIACPEILGDVVIDKVNPDGAYGTRLAGRLSVEERSALLASIMRRADGERSSGVPRGTGKRRSFTENAKLCAAARKCLI